jgi:uncharacterized protein
MFERFFPDLAIDKVQDIDFEMLKSINIKGLILDIDNTLVPMHIKVADENAVKWVEQAKASGFKICIVSNASKQRVAKFNENLKVLAIHKASKPGCKAFMNALKLMDIKAEETVVIGDQIFTDIYGGNKLNMFTILVKPIDERELFYIRLKRKPEKLILSSFKRKFQDKAIRRMKWKKSSALKRMK